MKIEDFHYAEVLPKKSQFENALNKSEFDGLILEFGVHDGGTIKDIAKLCADKIVHGFDSFIGLPEPWVRTKSGSQYRAGHFCRKGKLPEDLPENVNLTVGFFEDTLDDWKHQNNSPIQFIHIDSDLYSSAKTVLTKLNDQIKKGTVLVFDEISDWNNSTAYDNWEEGEWKALLEWMEEFDRDVSVLSRNSDFAGAVIVTK